VSRESKPSWSELGAAATEVHALRTRLDRGFAFDGNPHAVSQSLGDEVWAERKQRSRRRAVHRGRTGTGGRGVDGVIADPGIKGPARASSLTHSARLDGPSLDLSDAMRPGPSERAATLAELSLPGRLELLERRLHELQEGRGSIGSVRVLVKGMIRDYGPVIVGALQVTLLVLGIR
jgi:hypothetical protein